MNVVTIAGNLSKDPEIKYLESGKVITNFSMVTNGWDSAKKEKTSNFFNVTCYDKTAEFVGEYAKKGKAVTVWGTIESREYSGKTYWDVKATGVKFDQAIITINGKVDDLEERFTSNNKKVTTIKLEDNLIPIISFASKLELVRGSYITAVCTLDIENYNPVAKAFKIVEQIEVPF